tara:strand:- start:9793 stop:11805 length:2013 start_codon:yes stop_codon:yes gene_type:complete
MEDIEDLISSDTLELFVRGLVEYELKTEKDYRRGYNDMKVKYKLCPSKTKLRQAYNELITNNLIKPNESFLKYSLKRKCRSSSGVTVITILTSPTPEYTNSKGEKVVQSFSCGKNCAYCPNEPEIRLQLSVVDVSKNKVKVKTNDDIHLIRLLNYVIKGEQSYCVENCSHFKEDTFIITFKDENVSFHKDDEFIGVKIEQPRSYLSTEPAVLRANRNKFNPVLQIYDRADALEICGHEVDKIEILVLGGTWDHYPLEYQEEYIRDIYYSINTLPRRFGTKGSLEEEIKYSEESKKRIIGLTLETRPDCISLRQVRRMRKFNVTRLQIGVQHIDNDILREIERGCTTEDIIYGNNLWKQNGGKVDWHLMPDLPGSSMERDISMFKKIFGVNSITEVDKNYYIYDLKYPEYQADQLKIYPCSVVDWTDIKKWYDNGTYKPYSEDEDNLIKVIIYIKNNIFPWVRLNRIVRDIPNLNIIGGNENVNLRQKILARNDVNCQCIRCREVKDNKFDISNSELFVRQYNGIDSTEYFISFESLNQEILYGFLRLRINHTNDNLIYPELEGCSFIRELHVYGKVVNHKDSGGNEVQHSGFGKRLLKKAEEISFENGIYKVAVISGVGVRKYYEKNGYELVKNYMIKKIYVENHNYVFETVILITIFIILLSILYDIYY